MLPTKINSDSTSLSHVTVRFAGDSGDGMQLTGNEFTKAVAVSGNDISTLADFPAEIRAPAGTLAGVSGFQVQFASKRIFTPGDQPDVLVVMNPAALKTNIKDLKTGGIVIANESGFTSVNLKKAGFNENPLKDNTLSSFRVVAVDMSNLVQKALESENLSVREVSRSKNFWALGLMYWIYQLNTAPQIAWIERKFQKKTQFKNANILAFRAGHLYGENTEVFQETYTVPPAKMLEKGTYRSITGSTAIAYGLITASKKSDLPLFLGSYPITPASDILHELSNFRHFGVTTFQAEDEIAAMCSAIGAAFGGSLAAVTTSGPGFVLKAEALGLGLMYELPMLVIDVQRAGPSTGMPTKPEQSDLLLAMYGRSGESPLPIIAPKSPSDCFDAALEAAKIAVQFMTPVIILSDAFIANSAKPWRLPDPHKISTFKVEFAKKTTDFKVYNRNKKTLAREWALPGTAGLEHRLGGLEKDQLSGDVSYDPQNHENMISLREQKVERIKEVMSPFEFHGTKKGELLLVGWGSTFGAIHQAYLNTNKKLKVSHLHLRWLNPLDKNLEVLLRNFKKVLVCELNTGQLNKLLRAKFLLPLESVCKVQGKPFFVHEIEDAIKHHLSLNKKAS